MDNIIATQTRINDVAKIARHYGFKHQVLKTLEEMDELKAELTAGLLDDGLLVGELVDVIIMTTQLSLFFNPDVINNEINFKLDRQLRRMDAENNNSCVDCDKYEPSDPNTICSPCEREEGIIYPKVCEWCDEYKGTPATTGICQRSGERVLYNFTCADWVKEKA